MKKLSIVIISLLILGIIFIFLKGYWYKKEISENRAKTVCKYVSCKEFPKTSESFFKYYIDGKPRRNSYGRCPKDSEEKLNKFFVIYYSTKDVEKIEVDFSTAITDTTTILNAGFTIDEIK